MNEPPHDPGSDSPPVELRLRFGLASFLEAGERYEARIPALRFANRVLAVSGVVLVLCAAYLFAVGDLALGATALACAALALFVDRGRRFFAVRSYRQSPHADEDVVITLGPAGFHGVGTRGEMHFPWSAFTHAYLERDGVLLLRGPNVHHWLPDRALVRGDEASLRALVREHVPQR